MKSDKIEPRPRSSGPGAQEDSLLGADCDREPIHIPGSIQPHGVLLAVDRLQTLQRASSNAAPLLVASPTQALGQPLARVLAPAVRSVASALAASVNSHGHAEGRCVVEQAGKYWNCLWHTAGEEVIVEFEPAGEARAGAAELGLLTRVLAHTAPTEGTTTLADLCQSLAHGVRAVAGFDRALVYRFHADWHGEVVAEERNERLPSYLGLRFPASDIPAQARALYASNRTRQIVDAAYVPCAILGGTAALPASLDLSGSVLRSVAPVHRRYMRNMGTASSLSISVLVDGKLWGLVSCHGAQPRHVPFDVRGACDLLAQVYAAAIAACLREVAVEEYRRLNQRLRQLESGLDSSQSLAEGFTRYAAESLELLGATGGAVVHAGVCTRLGEAPDEAAVLAIADWVQARVGSGVFAAHALSSEEPKLAPHAATASGVLAFSISGALLLWFRPEQVQEVRWAGEPRKAHGIDGGLEPRASFATWCETVRGRARSWEPTTVEVAEALRSAALRIALRQAEEQELRRVNAELEAFCHSVSHDLRAPFRQILAFAQLAQQSSSELTGEGVELLERIVRISAQGGKLVQELLLLSLAERGEISRSAVDMNELVAGVRLALEPQARGRCVEWKVGDLPEAFGNPNLLKLVVSNTLDNAVKYTGKRNVASIEVTGSVAGAEVVYTVRDNGAGFDPKRVSEVFQPFRRLHAPSAFEGTGLGMASARRVVSRHGGRMWAEGAEGVGSAFFFALPTREASRAGAGCQEKARFERHTQNPLSHR